MYYLRQINKQGALLAAYAARKLMGRFRKEGTT